MRKSKGQGQGRRPAVQDKLQGAADKVVVLVTCSTAMEADRIAWELVTQGLAACVNVLDGRVRSTYRWKGKVETAAEYLLLIKSSKKFLPELRSEVERLHSYDVPEVIALPIVGGSPAYLQWLAECLRPARGKGMEP